MARRRSEKPTPPRLPSDMPLVLNLRLTAGTEVDGITIQGEFTDGHFEGLSLEDTHIVNSSFTAADLNHLRLVDVMVEGSDFSGTNMEEASFTRVIFKNCRMSGASILGSQMRDVCFDEVRLDNVNLRRSTGDHVRFEHVNLKRGDLFAAHLTASCFFDCDLRGMDVSESKLPGARFHGSDLSEIEGGEYLRDVVIDSSQVLPLASRVFAGLHIRVEDDRNSHGPD